MRIAITGGMGFIGTEVASLLSDGDNEIILVDFWDELVRDYEMNRYPILERVYGNLSKASEVITPWEFIGKNSSLHLDVIVHLGAVVDTTDMCSPSMVENNVRFLEELVRTASSRSSIVFASSASVYGNGMGRPNNPYGLTKVLGEKIIASSPNQYACLRFFNVFGQMEHHKGRMASLPFKMSEAYRKGDKFDLHSPDAARDFVSVDSVARVIRDISHDMYERNSLGRRKYIQETYDVGTGRPTVLGDLDGFIMQATGNTSSAVRYVSMPDSLRGRYQNFTQAGVNARIAPGEITNTRDAIEAYYGKR